MPMSNMSCTLIYNNFFFIMQSVECIESREKNLDSTLIHITQGLPSFPYLIVQTCIYNQHKCTYV